MSSLCPAGSEGWGPLSPSRPVDFTSCFQYGALSVGLSTAFLAVAAVRLFRLKSKPQLPHELVAGGILRAKLLATATVMAVSAAELVAVWAQYPLVSVFTIAMALQTVAAVVAARLHYREQLVSPIASTLLLLYWLAGGALALMRLRTAVATGLADSSPVTLAPSAGYALLALLMLVLECQSKPQELYELLNEDDSLRDSDDVKHSYRAPEERANLFSRLTFAWLDPMLDEGLKRPLQMEDTCELSKRYYPEVATVKFRRNWEASIKSGRPGLIWTTICTYWREWTVSMVWQIIGDMTPFLNPILLSHLIGFVSTYNSDQAEPIENGYFYAVAMCGVSMIITLANQQHYASNQHFEMLLRVNFMTAVYRKALVLSNDTRKEHNIGGIVTHMSTDATRAAVFTSYNTYDMLMAPVQLVLAMYMLYRTLGWSIFVGVLAMAFSAPITARVIQKLGAINKELVEYRDRRMKLMNEVLSGIRIIKLYAWETPFIKRINDVRLGLELDSIRRFGSMLTVYSFVTSLLPFIVTFSTYTIYSTSGNESHGPLSPQLVFVSLALFNMLRAPLSTCTGLINSFVNARESYRRLHVFLTAEEIDFTAIGHAPYDRDSPTASTSDVLVSVNSGTFKWLSADEPVLRDISIQCKRDELVAVIGRVGAGKSSLVSAILGDMIKCSGTVSVCGTIAYVPQQAWIMNATLRDNILFGNRFDQEFYDRVVSACALGPDMEMLPAGDQTEIGEKGINLSGGQKARVSLARAVYARADTYLLDDPLAAVDAHVSKHIFTQVLGPQGLLKTRARILVTNAVQYLSSADNIVMLQGGKVAEHGPFAECMDRASHIYEFIHKFVEEGQGSSSSSGHTSDTELSEDGASGKSMRKLVKPSLGQADAEEVGGALARRNRYESRVALADQANDAGRTTTDEISQQGKVKWDIYRAFIKACGAHNVVAFLVALVVASFTGVGANLWLKHWASSNGQVDSAGFYIQQTAHSVFYYLLIYGGLGLLGALMSSYQSLLLWTRCSISASTEIHQDMLLGVMRSPVSFFDTTPVGRILNRFSSDISKCDTTLPANLSSLVGTVSAVTTSIIIIGFSTPMIIIMFLPLALIYRHTQKLYMASSRELKRLESTTRSPVYAHFQESVGGAATVRAYGHQSRFVCENEHRIEQYTRAEWSNSMVSRWLSLRLEVMGTFVMLGTNLLAIATLHYTGYGDAGMVGLAVTYSLRLTSLLSSIVKQATELENAMTHMERTVEYARLPQEAAEVIEDRRPGKAWPEQGVVEFKDYSTRYREGLDLVLKGLSFRVLPSQKVGIVGRTGAGKSSLTLALFRIIEAAEGRILIDGQDISQYGLFDVRNRLSIIPQDPVLFAGTVRENLDPFGQYSDQDIWHALELAHLADVIRSKDERLEFEVAQGGENFSVGQRQLICLARALLKRAKVLVLDEATAAIDNSTDAIIQQTIREEFKSCTVLTIAHRLNTIIDSDMILVVDGGRVAEYDTPQSLLQNEDSLFAQLVKESRTGTEGTS